MPFVDSRHYSRLSTFILSIFLLSTLDFFTLDSRLFTLDRLLLSTLDIYPRQLLSTLDSYSRLSTFTLDSRLSTFRYTHSKATSVFIPKLSMFGV